MSSKYKVLDSATPTFVTSTVVGWVDAFSREQYKEIVCDSLKFCIKNKGLKLHAWVIMPNHLHMIVSCQQGVVLGEVMRDFKKFTSRKVVTAIADNEHESRKAWMLNFFRFAATSNNGTDEYQFWQHEFHPVILDSGEKIMQRLNYLHENPVRAGIVWQSEDYKYSSAIDYYKSMNGILPITRLD
jgi:REP element-mobilizing transposase RayT